MSPQFPPASSPHLTSTGEKLRSALDLSTLSRAPAGGRWLGRGPGLYLNTRAGLDTGLCCSWGQGVTLGALGQWRGSTVFRCQHVSSVTMGTMATLWSQDPDIFVAS